MDRHGLNYILLLQFFKWRGINYKAKKQQTSLFCAFLPIFIYLFFFFFFFFTGLKDSVVCKSYWCSGGQKINPHQAQQHSFVEIDTKIFSTIILFLLLIQEELSCQFWWNNVQKNSLTLKAPVTTIVVCFVICLWFYKSFLQTVWTQIRVHTVCLYAKIGLKSLQEYSADDINWQNFQMQFFLALYGLTT